MTLRMIDLAGAEDDRRFSPFCWRTRMALAHKGLPVETIAWRFTEREVLAPSGQDKVPVLIDGERWIADSPVIAAYLEEAYPDRPSLFGGPAGMALTRFVQAWTEKVLHPALFPLILLDIPKHLHARDQTYFRTSREARLGPLEVFGAGREQRLPGFRESLAPLRTLLQAQPFLGGAGPLYADYIVFGAFQWARSVSDFTLLEPGDPVAAWRRRMLDLFDGLAAAARGYVV
jgi:glutathione S-transferase